MLFPDPHPRVHHGDKGQNSESFSSLAEIPKNEGIKGAAAIWALLGTYSLPGTQAAPL